MYNKSMVDPTPIDSPSLRLHKRQFTWQILVPMLAAALLGLAAGGFTIATGLSDASQTRLWADISTIWLVAPLLMLALIFTVVLGGVIYGLTLLMRVTPRYTGRAQELVGRVAAGIRKVADGSVKPFVWLHQAGAMVEALLKKL